jgi:PKD repeat protein
VSVTLAATDADHNPLTLRIVTQPAHGTVALASTVAVYFPEAGHVGADSFTFAANDGSTDSNLATVSLTVGVSPCTLTCDGSVPASAAVGSSVPCTGTATATGCGAPASYEWDFGDGSSPATTQNPSHAYGSSDTFRWTMTARAGGATCTDTGTLRTLGATPLRVPYLMQPVRVATSNHGQDLTLSWDENNCPSSGYHIIYGYGSGFSSFAVAGGVCAVGTSGRAVWAATPDPSADSKRLLWFLVAGDNGSSTEGSWGVRSSGAERGGTAASGVCGMSVKSTSGFCAAP